LEDLVDGAWISKAVKTGFYGFLSEQGGSGLRVGGVGAGFFEDEAVIEDRTEGFDTLGGAVPVEGITFGDAIGEEVEEEFGLDGSGLADKGEAFIRTLFDVYGDKKRGLFDPFVGFKDSGGPVGEEEFEAFAAAGGAIGEGAEVGLGEGHVRAGRREAAELGLDLRGMLRAVAGSQLGGSGAARGATMDGEGGETGMKRQ